LYIPRAYGANVFFLYKKINGDFGVIDEGRKKGQPKLTLEEAM